MLFNSLTFAGFFGVVLFLHYLPLPWNVKKFNLLWLSYLFYAAWNPAFSLLLGLSTVIDWFAAQGVSRAKNPARKRLWLIATLVFNLGALGIFKYGNFLTGNVTWLLNAVGLHAQPPTFDIILPVGISFYTFVTLSYTLDVYWGRMKPWTSFLDYAMFVSFFPHLVAGPILRAASFLPQCAKNRKPSLREFQWGLALLVIGLFNKVVVADYLLAPAADTLFRFHGAVSFADAWVGTLAFAGQIFCDFAGYSSCAVGIAQCLGFWLPDNFRSPYAAIGFSDFWRRWHISLSTWLRDYLYIPLGGNRLGERRTYINLLITMLLGGLWHGAAWTFIVWGALHGGFLAAERWLKGVIQPQVLTHLSQSPVFQFAAAMGTFLCVCLAWVFFRASDFTQAFSFIQSMVGFGQGSPVSLLGGADGRRVITVVLIMLVVQWALRTRSLAQVAWRPTWLAASALGLAILAIFLTPGGDRAFIYFQF